MTSSTRTSRDGALLTPPGSEVIEDTIRVRQIFLITDRTDGTILKYLTARDPSGLASDLIEVIEEMIPPDSDAISKYTIRALRPSEDIEEMSLPVKSITKPLYQVEIHTRPPFAGHDIIHLINDPCRQPLYWLPIQVITDQDDPNAAILETGEVDSFNLSSLKKTQRAIRNYKQNAKLDRLLINPNGRELQYIEIGPLTIDDVDSSTLKYLGGHLHHSVEYKEGEEGYLIIPQAARTPSAEKKVEDKDFLIVDVDTLEVTEESVYSE